MIINSVKGANASAAVYSITETAKLNGLNPYYYPDHLLSEMPKIVAELNENNQPPDREKLEKLLPWSVELPQKCRARRR